MDRQIVDLQITPPDPFLMEGGRWIALKDNLCVLNIHQGNKQKSV